MTLFQCSVMKMLEKVWFSPAKRRGSFWQHTGGLNVALSYVATNGLHMEQEERKTSGMELKKDEQKHRMTKLGNKCTSIYFVVFLLFKL